MHAVIGGAVAMAQGGDFVSGALTGAISAGASLTLDQSGIDALGQSGDGIPDKIAARTAVAGGTASVLSGGKFANGAITGAFAQMYNGEACGVISSCERNLEGATPERIETLKGAAWALTPGTAGYDCESVDEAVLHGLSPG